MIHPPQAFVPYISSPSQKYFSRDFSTFPPSQPHPHIILIVIQLKLCVQIISVLHLTASKDRFSPFSKSADPTGGDFASPLGTAGRAGDPDGCHPWMLRLASRKRGQEP